MTADFIINSDYRVVFSCARGTLSLASIAACRSQLSADPRFRPDFSSIADFTDTTPGELSVGQIAQLAEDSIFDPTSRRAFVLGSDLSFGLGRVFHAYAEAKVKSAVNIKIVRTLDEAIAWTGVPEKIAEEAFSQLRSAKASAIPQGRANGPRAIQ